MQFLSNYWSNIDETLLEVPSVSKVDVHVVNNKAIWGNLSENFR